MTAPKHLVRIDYEIKYGNGIVIPMVAMYNSSRISEHKVRKLIMSGYVDSNSFVVNMSKEQYKNLLDIEEPSENNKDEKYDEFLKDLVMEQQGGIQ